MGDRQLDELPLRRVRPHGLDGGAGRLLAHRVAVDPTLLDVDRVAEDVESRRARDVAGEGRQVEPGDAAAGGAALLEVGSRPVRQRLFLASRNGAVGGVGQRRDGCGERGCGDDD